MARTWQAARARAAREGAAGGGGALQHVGAIGEAALRVHAHAELAGAEVHELPHPPGLRAALRQRVEARLLPCHVPHFFRKTEGAELLHDQRPVLLLAPVDRARARLMDGPVDVVLEPGL